MDKEITQLRHFKN